MENGRAGVIEDDEVVRDLLIEGLERKGHTVVLKAGTFEEAINLIDEIKPGDLDFCLVDGNLTAGNFDSEEGTQITIRLKERLGAIAVIGISVATEIEEADKNINKEKFPEIIEYIKTEL